MTASVKLIAPARGEADPHRAALGDAIAAKRQAEQAALRQKMAIGKAKQLVEEAQQKLADAEGSVAAAKAQHASAIAASMTADSAVPTPGATKQARVAERDAEDELEAARAAVTALEGGLADLEENIKRRRGDVLIARANLLQPIIEALLDEGRAAKARLNEIKQILPLLVQGEPELGFTNSIEGLRLSNRLFNRSLEKDIGDLLASNVFLGGANIERWRSFREALLSDAQVLPPAGGAAPPETP